MKEPQNKNISEGSKALSDEHLNDASGGVIEEYTTYIVRNDQTGEVVGKTHDPKKALGWERDINGQTPSNQAPVNPNGDDFEFDSTDGDWIMT